MSVMCVLVLCNIGSSLVYVHRVDYVTIDVVCDDTIIRDIE